MALGPKQRDCEWTITASVREGSGQASAGVWGLVLLILLVLLLLLLVPLLLPLLPLLTRDRGLRSTADSFCCDQRPLSWRDTTAKASGGAAAEAAAG